MVIGPGDHDFAGLQGLAQGIQGLAAEFRQLVEEQDAVVRQGDLARPGPVAAAGEGGHAR